MWKSDNYYHAIVIPLRKFYTQQFAGIVQFTSLYALSQQYGGGNYCRQRDVTVTRCVLWLTISSNEIQSLIFSLRVCMTRINQDQDIIAVPFANNFIG